jgi:chorismate--pyruvate lyase
MPVLWQAPSEIKNLSPVVYDWLLNTGSLTERLQALTNHFNVVLLGQDVLSMDESEQKHLAQSQSDKWQIREVILQGMPLSANANNGADSRLQDWVFARSVLPNQLCQSQWANLGKQPLGSRIFNDDNFVRSEFEIGQLAYHPLTLLPFEPGQTCWARRSKFTIEKFELLVAEAFLPQSPCYW